MASARQQRKMLQGIFALCLLAQSAVAKMVMGIADSEDFQLVSTFCFKFPSAAPGQRAPNGHIHSQTIVSADGHKFLVVNYTDLTQGLTCDQLIKKAKVIEPLVEKTKEVVAYDLTLNVEPSMDGQHIAAVIARCGQQINAEYIVEFTNPEGSFDQQFACAEQGLLQSYFLLSLITVILGPTFFSALRTLHRRQAHNDLSAMFFTASAFFGVRVWLFTVHLVVYSRNGMGLSMLLFVAQFLDFLSTTMAMVVLVALVHGIYLTKPCVPVGSTERLAIMRVTGCFTATFLLSTLFCGFKVDGPISPFGVLRGAPAMPYLLSRTMAGFFCLSQGMKLAQEAEAAQKKPYILRFTWVAAGWLLIMPFIMMFSGEDSWHREAIIMDLASVAMFSILLWDFWPTRFGALFSCIKPTERMHPYAEFS
eukprot:TRINITY_DN64667_c0_g1_i1.p1 TRINITY_DN64667_c0_g1~~TRINITY_DN64667_c0_g1_i1.p1  ORF type:complete len:437 (-),score=90.40 TRINITY_DN64667_c0_g1_i1:96-1358(-)